MIEPTLELLGLLTGQELGRDPKAWQAWYAAEHGEEVDLHGAVSETLVLVRPLEGEDGRQRYRVQDRTFDELDDVVGRVKAIRERSPLPVSIVVLLEDPKFEATSIPQGAQGLAEVLLPLDLSMTVSPATDVFYPPFRPTGPG